MGKLSWFKHYNTASEGQLIGDLLAKKDYEAVSLIYVIMEMISRFETEESRGQATVPIERIARTMNMKPSTIDRVIGRISSVARSDLICVTEPQSPRNRTFLMRNWMKLQETRGGKREAKNEQKMGEVRSERLESESEEEKLKKSPYPLLVDNLVDNSKNGFINPSGQENRKPETDLLIKNSLSKMGMPK